MTASDDAAVLDRFREYRASGSRRLRNALVEEHMGLAVHLARRFTQGRSDDDIRQVAMIGLVKSVDRFDPDREVAFAAFASRTIEGEIKRHFRDKTWAVRVPRSVTELHLQVRRAVEQMSQQLGRSPSVDEVAQQLGISRDDVIAGLDAATARAASSLDSPAADDNRPGVGQGVLGGVDDGFVLAEHRQEVAWLLEQLPEREREIVVLRFYEELSQSEIAERMGMSQMHVSRLLRRSFAQLRELLADGDPDRALGHTEV